MMKIRFAANTILLTSLLICAQVDLAHPTEIYSTGQMAGTISAISNKSKIISVSDTVKVKIDAALVVQGDRLSIFEPLITGIRKSKIEDADDKPLIHVGEIVVTGIRGKIVYGVITSASKELLAGSYVKPANLKLTDSSELLGFLQKVASAKLNNPVEDIIQIGITDTVNEAGDVTHSSAKVSKQFRDAVCNRIQFNCAHTKQIKATLSKYDVKTSKSIGKFMRVALNREVGVEILITSKVEYIDNSRVITLVAWDLINEMKSKPYIISSPTDIGFELEHKEEVVDKFHDVSHGSLKIRLNSDRFTGVRRVDYLQTINMEDIVYKRFMSDISTRFTESVAWKDISITLDGVNYSPRPDGGVYDSILPAKTHLLCISATPILAGDQSVLLGKPLEEYFEIEIPPDTAIHTEIILKIAGKKAILIVDSVPEI